MLYWKDIPVTVIRNPRARKVWLKMRSCRGLEAVLPFDMSLRDLPAILDRHAGWIEKRRTVLESRGEGPGQPFLPDSVRLVFVGRDYAVNYAHGLIAGLVARKGELVVTCPPGREILAARLLQHFLVREGKRHLVPACRELADACGVAVSAVSVRNQKTLWGSCSVRGGISLNARLLLLPQELAHHVMMHEFCHVFHRNHGSGFQERLRALDPMTSVHEKALRRAWEELPGWTKQ
mgnify:CR=1 FL=1